MSFRDLLAPYTYVLDGGTAEGLEPTDAQFVALVGAMDRRDWADCRERLVAIEGERRLDVRILGICTYLAWRDGGVAALPLVLRALTLAASSNFARLGPAKKRAAHLELRAAWSLSTIVDDVIFHAKAGTPEWTAWTAAVTAELEVAIREARTEADAAFLALGAPRAAEALARLGATLDPHVRGFVERTAELEAERRQRQEAAPGRAPAEGRAELEPRGRTTVRKVREEVMGEHTASTAHLQPGTQHMELPVSHAFIELLQKLKAFETLVARKKFQKAALVADDLTDLVSKFDPRSYFPDLFSDFGKNLAEHIEVLAENWDRRDSVAWKALEQYYRVDLQRFVDE